MTWSKAQAEEATEHVLALAARLRVEVIWTRKPEQWQATFNLLPGGEAVRQALVPQPTSPLRYLLALHELGHHGSRVAQRWWLRYPELGAQALVEGAAWAWATRMAKPALTEAMTEREWRQVASYFVSYLRYAAVVEPPEGQRVRI